jgi:hypothetical protein
VESDLTYGDSFSISFDLPDRLLGFINQFEEEIRKAIPEIISNITALLEIQWKQEATNSLKSVEKYNNSFSQREISPFHIILENNHPAVFFLESGTAPFDMKRMLDTSAHVKVSEKTGNRYIRIPFEGKVKDYIAGGVDKSEIRAMAGSTFSIKSTGGRERRIITKYGDRLTDMGGLGVKRKYFTVLNATREKLPNKTNSPNMGFTPYTEYKAATTIDYTWKSSPYENAVKMVDFQGKTIGMKTFRTISDASDPNSWIHPGIHASHIAEKAVEAVKTQLDAEIAKVLEPLYNNFNQLGSNAGFD